MKKPSLSMLCALGILSLGCNLDIMNEQLGTLSNADLCVFSGGEFNEQEKNCYCGGNRCGENISCGVDAVKNEYYCISAGNKDYPQYTCTMQGMTLCFDRLTTSESGSIQTSGYFISCDGTSWSTPSPCDNGYSCSAYLEHDLFYATKCGECNNIKDKDAGCIRGTKKEAH